MDIKYLGHACFQLKGKTATVVTDPFDPTMVGLKLGPVEADIVTVSHHHKDHDQSQQIGGTPVVFDIPGEYEKNGVRIFGYSVYHDDKKGAERGRNTLFKIEMDEISILHCGDLGHTLDDDLIEEIDQIDVLLIPVGGTFTIGPDTAHELIAKLEPSIVIPMHYNSPKLNQDNFGSLLPVTDFLSRQGISEPPEPVKKLSLKKADLTEETKVVVMDA